MVDLHGQIRDRRKDDSVRDKAVVSIDYYTDPLCSWSWAFEPQWRRLRYEYRDHIRWRYVLGGLLKGWDTYNDPMNAVSRPLQMGPLWFETKHMSGMPIDEKIWMHDPPESSYPACIAVKAAALQSADAEEIYLRTLREAVMMKGLNIARQEVLIGMAKKVADDHPAIFDSTRFVSDLGGEEAKDAFREDLARISLHRITRFPAMTITNGQKGVVIVGYRPYAVLLQAINEIAPGLAKVRQHINKESYAGYWRNVLDRELAELDQPRHQGDS